MVKVLFVSPLQVQLHCGALTTRPQTKSHRRPVTGCNQQTGEPAGENENSANDESPPLISKNWREFRAGLVAGSAQRHLQAKESAYRTGHWAHSLSLPERGCFLASHPAYYRRQAPYLTQSVVLLTEYDEANGATGLILNRPFGGTAEDLAATGLFGRSLDISSTNFAKQPVYLGGPNSLQKGVISVIHSDESVGGEQPLDGVFVCDIGQFISSATGSVDCQAARLFSGCIKWTRGTLESEVDEGSWYCVAASELFALKHCIKLPKPLWVEIMQSQGGTFERIANRVYDTDDGNAEGDTKKSQ